MDFEMKKEKLSSIERVCNLSAEQGIDLDVSLPDYCSDIKRVLRCFVIPGIGSTEVTGNRVSVKGDITIRLLYVSEGEKIDCCEQTVELSKYADTDNMPENPIVIADAKTEYVNCRAASQRRFTVNGNIGVTFKVFAQKEKEVCFSAADETLQVKSDSVCAAVSGLMSEKIFDLSETVSLPDGKKNIGKIIAADSTAKLESVKAVSGKVLIKGELVCDVMYLCDTKENEIETVRHAMPISQIIECSGLDESYSLDIKQSVKNFIVCPKSDSSGSNRLIEFAAKVCAFIRGTKEGEIRYITDCFCTKYESKAQYENIVFTKKTDIPEKKKNISKTLDLPSGNSKELLDIREISNSCSLSVGENKLDGKVNVVFGILFKDGDDKVQYAQRNADFEFDCEMKESSSKISCDTDLCIRNISANLSGGKCAVKFDCDISGTVYSLVTKRVLESVSADTEKEKPCSEAALTVYYCHKGEKIWDIAKRYNISEKNIRDENDIDGDCVAQDMMLMIS